MTQMRLLFYCCWVTLLRSVTRMWQWRCFDTRERRKKKYARIAIGNSMSSVTLRRYRAVVIPVCLVISTMLIWWHNRIGTTSVWCRLCTTLLAVISFCPFMFCWERTSLMSVACLVLVITHWNLTDGQVHCSGLHKECVVCIHKIC